MQAPLQKNSWDNFIPILALDLAIKGLPLDIIRSHDIFSLPA